MVDFNEFLKKKKEGTASSPAPLPPAAPPKEIKPRAEGRDKDEDISMLELLTGKFRSRLNDWERKFCDDNLVRLKKYDNASLSVKQAEIIDKTWAEHADDGPYNGLEESEGEGDTLDEMFKSIKPSLKDDDVPF